MKKLTNKDVDERLIGRNIKRLDDYINIDTPIYFQCLIKDCNHTWPAKPNHILNDNTGCPKCAGNLPLTNKDIDKRLIGRNIKRLEDYINIDTPIYFQCSIKHCNHSWPTVPTSIINNNSGCPKCLLNKNEKLVLSVLEQHHVSFVSQFKFYELNSKFPKYEIDFYLPAQNIMIEYNGAQHYESVRFGGISRERADVKFKNQIKRDKNLKKLCKQNNINLICIDGRKYKGDKLKQHIINTIIPLLTDRK